VFNRKKNVQIYAMYYSLHHGWEVDSSRFPERRKEAFKHAERMTKYNIHPPSTGHWYAVKATKRFFGLYYTYKVMP
jgi:hypothetical protein